MFLMSTRMPGGHVEVAELLGDGHVADHRAADEGDLAVVVGGGVEDLLDAVHVRGEGRDDHALGGLAEEPVQGGADFLLGGGEARHVGVRGVRHEQVHAFFAQLGEVAEVGDPAVQRQLVHLEVAGVQHGAAGGAEEHGEGVRDRVVDGDEFAFERAELLDLALGDGLGDRLDPVFLQLRLDEGQRQLGAHQGDVGAQAQQVRDGADVVLVAVGQDDGDDVIEAVLDVGEIGQDQVDAGLGFLGEEDAAVDDEQLAVDFEDGHVAADLPQSAERNDPQGVLGQFRRRDKAGKGGLGHNALLSRR